MPIWCPYSSGKRVIVSTGTKNLQEQLFYKDVPFLERRSSARIDNPAKLRVCYMKGRNNYLCRKKLYDLTDQPVLSGLEEIDQFRTISDWEKNTETGDRAELSTLPEASLSGPSSTPAPSAASAEVPEFERCFITEMRRSAPRATSSSSTTISFSPTSAIKQAAEERPMPEFCPMRRRHLRRSARAGRRCRQLLRNLGLQSRVDELVRDVELAAARQQARLASICWALSGACASARNFSSR